VILNYATFVREELDDKPAAQSDLDQISIAAERASQLTRQLLAFARREVLQPHVLNLNVVIADVVKLLRRTLGEQVDLRIVNSPLLWSIDADPGQLEQVLINLVVNARDAMPEGGTVTLDTENVDVDDGYTEIHPILLPGRYVRLRVSDTGIGMEKAVLDHVFEPFFTTKTGGKGTGLGLPMVFGIIRQTGGDIQLYSEVGIGTTCQVFLPASDRPPALVETPVASLVLRGTETILLVEDEDAMREVTRRILARNGYDVVICATGQEAINLVATSERTIDLLLTDVVMPQMTGKDLANRFQELRPAVPVLFMSGYAQPVLGATLGDGYVLLEKPFVEQQLLEKLRDALDSAR
jgi:CheY-like chemotaxis protein